MLPGGSDSFMNIDADEAQNMFSPEAALSESRSKSNLPAGTEETGRMTIGEGPHGTLDVINEKNSEVDGE